jgi:hypothetical protein
MTATVRPSGVGLGSPAMSDTCGVWGASVPHGRFCRECGARRGDDDVWRTVEGESALSRSPGDLPADEATAYYLRQIARDVSTIKTFPVIYALLVVVAAVAILASYAAAL